MEDADDTATNWLVSPKRARRLLVANQRLRRALEIDFSSPAMLDLLLFLAAEEGQEGVTTSRCCACVTAPRTTALRWIASLAAASLIVQQPRDEDGRVTMLRLTPKARSALGAWMQAIDERQYPTP